MSAAAQSARSYYTDNAMVHCSAGAQHIGDVILCLIKSFKEARKVILS